MKADSQVAQIDDWMSVSALMALMRLNVELQ
jgi:hypothetical protein